MNILLITTLYPGYLKQPRNEISYAIHYYVKEWVNNNNDVKVVRLWPYYPFTFEIFDKAFISNKYKNKDTFILDDVKITRYPILKIPKIDFRTKDIAGVSSIIISDLKKDSFCPDVIVCHMLNPSIYISKNISDLFGVPIVAVLHNGDIFFLKKRLNFIRFMRVEPYINRIGFRSDKIKREYLNIYNGSRKNSDFFKVVSGINKSDIISEEKLNIKMKREPRTIIVACNLIPLKNVDILIDSINPIKDKYNFKLLIIGDGPQKNKLEAIVNELGLNNKVFFLGEKSREDVLELMEDSDIFAMVSSPETFGLVYIEAMAKGCITIGTRGEGIDGVIVDNFNGYLCSPKSIDELTSIFNKIFKLSEHERQQVVKNAINTSKNMSQELLAQMYLDEIYKTLR